MQGLNSCDEQPCANRRIDLGEATAKGHSSSFVSNHVATTKYTLWNIVPRNLMEQFHRAANIWFLVVSVFQMLPLDISPTNKYATLLPLCGVLFVSFCKDAFEDYKRWRNDRRINNQHVQVVDCSSGHAHLRDACWRDVTVGTYIRLTCDAPVPADTILLSSSQKDGAAYVDTAQLDGETSLKQKFAVEETMHMVNTRELQAIEGYVQAELPNEFVQVFAGMLFLSGIPRGVPLDLKNIVLRGSTLRKTAWAFGIVVYTGTDTKLVKNSKKSKGAKRSHTEIMANYLLVIVFSLLTFTALVSSISANLLFNREGTGTEQMNWVWPTTSATMDNSVFLSFLTFMILYNNLIPLSLYMTVDLVRAFQAQLMERDSSMYHKGTDTSCVVRSSGLCEDLGQVEFVMSDKTGTLTQNEMCFKAFWIQGSTFGYWDTNLGPVDHIVAMPSPQVCQPLSPVLWTALKDLQMTHDMQLTPFFPDMSPSMGDVLEETLILNDFFMCLASCHTAIPEKMNRSDVQNEQGRVSTEGSEKERRPAQPRRSLPRCTIEEDPFLDGSSEQSSKRTALVQEAQDVFYTSPSPDEEALLSVAKDFGFFLQKESQQHCHHQCPWSEPQLHDCYVQRVLIGAQTDVCAS